MGAWFHAPNDGSNFPISLNGGPYTSTSDQPLMFGVEVAVPTMNNQTNDVWWNLAVLSIEIKSSGPTPQSLPVDIAPLTVSGANTATTSGPVTKVNANFTDASPGAASADWATIDWGDGTSYTGVVSGGSGSFTATGSHIYATNGTHTITVTIIDSLGAATTAGTTFTGGLQLDGEGNLLNYDGATATTIDTGVESFLDDNADPTPTVFTLHTNGGLWAITGSSPQQIDAGVESILVGPDGTLYVLHTSGSLTSIAPGTSFSSQFIAATVQTIVEDSQGDIDRLDTNGSLHILPPGSAQTWATLQPSEEADTVVSYINLDSGGTSVDVVYTDGDDWQLTGSTFSDEVGPTFSWNVPTTTAAGVTFVAFPATLTVLDDHGERVTGYTGTVTFADSDAAAVAAGDGPPLQHTFTAADNGALSFPLTFLTSGTQTLTVTDNGGLTASATLTVNAGKATQFSVTTQPVPVLDGTAAPITVTAYDAYGNVATGYTGPVTLAPVNAAAASPITYTYTAADKGSHVYDMTFSKTGAQKLTASGGGLAGTGTVLVTAGPYSLSQSTVFETPSVVWVGGQVAVSLTVRDALGNQTTSGVLSVVFTLGAGSTSTGTSGAAVDNGDGTYTAIFKAGTLVGIANLTATINGVAITSSPAALTVTPGLSDPGFEQVQVGAGKFVTDPTGSAWSFAGTAGISANGSAFTSGNPAAPQGTQVAFLQEKGSFTQSVAGWSAGTYTISFDAAQRGNYGKPVEDFELLVDGYVVGTFKPTGTSYQSYTTGRVHGSRGDPHHRVPRPGYRRRRQHGFS